MQIKLNFFPDFNKAQKLKQNKNRIKIETLNQNIDLEIWKPNVRRKVKK